MDSSSSSSVGSSLLSKLQSPDDDDLSHIHHLFSDYLHPFTHHLDLIPNPNPNLPTENNSQKLSSNSNYSTSTAATSSSLRSLAKRFLPFLNRSLSLIHKWLSSETPKKTPKIDEKSALQLFSAYKLCLDCMDCITSELDSKPYVVCIRRARLMHCFEAWGWHAEVQSEGLFALERLRGIEIGGCNGEAALNKYLPVLGEESGVDHKCAVFVVNIVVKLVNCVRKSQTKQEGEYQRVIDLVAEAVPWFRVLDANKYEKMHTALVTYLYRCTLFLVGEFRNFNNVLVRDFCSATFAEYSKSVMKDQLPEFARRICSSLLFSAQGNWLSSITDILTCVLDFMASECEEIDFAFRLEPHRGSDCQLEQHRGSDCSCIVSVDSVSLTRTLQGRAFFLRPLSYCGADVFILAFSLISKASYENISKKGKDD